MTAGVERSVPLLVVVVGHQSPATRTPLALAVRVDVLGDDRDVVHTGTLVPGGHTPRGRHSPPK